MRAQLQLVDLLVWPWYAYQLLVNAVLHHLPFLHDHDSVGVPHAAQAVGNDESGPALHYRYQGLAYEVLGLRVHAGRGVVKDEYRRIQQQRTGDCQALSLSAGESDASLAHVGVVSLGQRFDEVVELRQLGGLNHVLLGGEDGAVCDVGAYGGGEDEYVLLHNAHVVAQRCQGDVPDVHAVDGDPSAGDVVEARDEVHDGGLAAARGAQYCQDLGAGNVDVHFLEHGRGLLVPE